MEAEEQPAEAVVMEAEGKKQARRHGRGIEHRSPNPRSLRVQAILVVEC
jgi:hypothetical protein